MVIVPRAEVQLTLCGGVSLLIDETALEESASYMSDSNSVGGLCWTHSHSIDPPIAHYYSALNLTEALKEGKVDLGRELTVITAHIFGADVTYPILAAPMCKSKGATEMIFVFKTAIDAWKVSGAEEKVGPLWSFATDGDTTRRKGGHHSFCLYLSPSPHRSMELSVTSLGLISSLETVKSCWTSIIHMFLRVNLFCVS